MKRVLLINECFSDNIGDQAIAFALKSKLEENNLNVSLVDFSGRRFVCDYVEASSKKINFLSVDVLLHLRAILKLFRIFPKILNCAKQKYDLVVIGGGQLILSNRNFPLLMMTWCFLLSFFNQKIILLGVGAGKKINKFDFLLYKKSLKKVKAVFLRNNSDITYLFQKVGQVSKFCPDVVYLLNRKICPDSEKMKKKRKCLICVTDYSVYLRYFDEMGETKKLSLEDYLQLWEKIVLDYIDRKYEVLLSATTHRDYEQSKALFERMEPCCSIKCVYRPPELKAFCDSLSEYSSIVSGRMHALILGHIFGLEIVPFKISPKIKEWCDEYLCCSSQELSSMAESVMSEVLIEYL